MNKFDEALKQSREKQREHISRALTMQRKRIKKEKMKDFILFIVLLVGFILSICLAMKLGQDFTNDCTQVHSRAYCEQGL